MPLLEGQLVSRVFISCASPEFENEGGRFPELRSDIASCLRRADCDVKVQEDFRQEGKVDTVEKLDGYIRQCEVVVHLVGELPGSTANEKAVASYLKSEPDFLANQPELRDTIKGPNGDFPGISYTQWEAFIAIHHGIPLLVYSNTKPETNPHPQQAHLDRLEKLARHHAEPFNDAAHLFRMFVGDIKEYVSGIAPRPEIAQTKAGRTILRHSPDMLFGRDKELKTLDQIWHAVIGERGRNLNVYSLVAWGGSGKTSLVAHWVIKRMASRGWPGVERYFDWSFYSQGAKETSQAGADIFINEALQFFGDPDPTLGNAWDRGQRLAKLVRDKRTLLVLDGIEPLQHPPNSPQAGELKDDGLVSLLQGLAMDNPGLCLVTSREPLKNLETFHGGTAEESRLDHLTKEAAISLLQHLSVTGTGEEMQAAWKDAGGHALTIQLLGRFLGEAHGGDIRRIDEVKFEVADRETQGRTAMRVMLAYERWMESAGPERQRDLAVLRLTGLFDRPASPDCVAALRAQPAIPGLTDAIVDLEDWQWNKALTDLQSLDLIAEPEPSEEGSPLPPPVSQPLDAHPLVREYFAGQLRENSQEAFESAHGRLFDHLCETTEHLPDTLLGLQPLYQAVTHGCLAGRHEEARANVYRDRILRGTGSNGYYSTKKLGALGSDLGAIASFFDSPWRRLSPNLSEADQAWLLNEAAFRLRALGRLNEAREPMQVGLEMRIQQEVWKSAAIIASNLSELELTLGLLSSSVSSGRRAVEFADRSEDAFEGMVNRTTAADALHQHGELSEAHDLFEEAERMQAERQPQFELLYSLAGFHCCDLLLAPAERAAWSSLFEPQGDSPGSDTQPAANQTGAIALRLMSITDACKEATRRATQTLEWANTYNLGLLAVALDHLTLARASLYRVILESSGQATADMLLGIAPQLDQALTGLRKAGQAHLLCNGLLTGSLFAWLVERSSVVSTENGKHEPALKSTTSQTGDDTSARHGSDRRATDDWPTSLNYPPQHFLDEAQLIAERGPMPLYLAEIQLNKARLFEDKDALAKARTLIEKYEYKRRLPELEDAEAVL